MTAIHAPAKHSVATSTKTATSAGSSTAAGADAKTATGASTAATEVPDVRWTSPEAKLWVATRGADFAGFVEFREGHYVVTDGRGAQLDDCATLREAKALIVRADEPAKLPAALTYVAVVTGGVAVIVFGAGLAVLGMG
jgi:hypothetical protein